MRERIKDGERIKHIIEAINVIIENKDKHSFEEVVADKIVLFGFVKQSTASAQVRLFIVARYLEVCHPICIFAYHLKNINLWRRLH